MKSVYSEKIRHRAGAARRRGRLARPTRSACWGRPGRGPYILIHLIVERGRITRALFDANDCPVTLAVGSALAELLEGRALAELDGLGREDLLALTGEVPPGKTYCLDGAAELVRQLRGALKTTATPAARRGGGLPGGEGTTDGVSQRGDAG